MEFKFDAGQSYQLQAIHAITNLFEGQPYIEAGLDFAFGMPSVRNRLDLDEDSLLLNLQNIQQENGIQPDATLLPTEQRIQTADGEYALKYYNFSIEMETGTGKTYVYIRTALELYRKYGFRKFIIVVPSIAIREGVIKTFKITHKHFRDLYGNLPYRYYTYDSANLSQVRQFAYSDSIEFMVMTIDAFNKAKNVIYQSTDRLQGDTPIHLVQSARPILILDEPQTKMEGDKNILALGDLMPLMTLRYSATHRTPYNRVYRLTPYDAYRQNLVKRVEVASIIQENDFNRAYIELVEISATKRTMQATLKVHKQQKSGAVVTQIKVKPGDDLFEKTKLLQYQHYILDRIEYGCVVFNVDGTEVEVCEGQSAGEDTKAVYQAQIATAIEEHFRKQRKLRDAGIKVLTLFFIDKVANYRGDAGEKGMIRMMFDEAFERLKQAYPEWQGVSADQVQSAYFAKKSSGEWDDSTTGTAQKDQEAYDLIMKDKERLLSFDEPVSFIFSHSALNEGWDNPNIFQICALRDVKSSITKRQQIGRGVRLAVNQEGDRVYNERVNILTVIASESYQLFVQSYQNEIEEIYGKGADVPIPVNKRAERTVYRRKEFYLSDNFRELWERISRKTRYSVQIDTDRVVQSVADALQKVTIKAPRITAVKAEMILNDSDTFEAVQRTASRDMVDVQAQSSLPSLIKRIMYLLEFQSIPLNLSRKSIWDIIQYSGRMSDALRNPHEFATLTVRIVQEAMADHLVKGVQYERVEDWYEMSFFDAEFQSWEDHLIRADKSLYDHIETDSGIESAFVKAMDERQDIRMYIRLPSWFVVPTPVGNYNPDWAIVMDDPNSPEDKKLYLVRETKGEGELRPTEKHKTECGEKHFSDALGVSYRIVTTASELP